MRDESWGYYPQNIEACHIYKTLGFVQDSMARSNGTKGSGQNACIDLTQDIFSLLEWKKNSLFTKVKPRVKVIQSTSAEKNQCRDHCTPWFVPLEPVFMTVKEKSYILHHSCAHVLEIIHAHVCIHIFQL